MENNITLLFQGDSITDCGRDYQDINSLGAGYPNKVNEYLKTFLADKNIIVINKGISGNRVADLENRWQEDCLDLSPDYLSILIGINDMWRHFDSSDPTTCENYEATYDRIIKKALEKNKNLKIIILEPFLLPVDDKFEIWRHKDLSDKILAARRIARKYNAEFIPLDGLFQSMLTKNEATYWSGDGVHPSDAGHALIAQEFIERIIK